MEENFDISDVPLDLINDLQLSVNGNRQCNIDEDDELFMSAHSNFADTPAKRGMKSVRNISMRSSRRNNMMSVRKPCSSPACRRQTMVIAESTVLDLCDGYELNAAMQTSHSFMRSLSHHQSTKVQCDGDGDAMGFQIDTELDDDDEIEFRPQTDRYKHLTEMPTPVNFSKYNRAHTVPTSHSPLAIQCSLAEESGPIECDDEHKDDSELSIHDLECSTAEQQSSGPGMTGGTYNIPAYISTMPPPRPFSPVKSVWRRFEHKYAEMKRMEEQDRASKLGKSRMIDDKENVHGNVLERSMQVRDERLSLHDDIGADTLRYEVFVSYVVS